LWSNAYVDENVTIDLIVNAMMLVKTMLRILQQGLEKGTLNFDIFDQVIKNISKDIDVTIDKT
jgi:hypothetical protein